LIRGNPPRKYTVSTNTRRKEETALTTTSPTLSTPPASEPPSLEISLDSFDSTPYLAFSLPSSELWFCNSFS
jgi:hypothetical protein